MPRPEDRWGDIVSPLMVSDNYLLGLDRLLHNLPLHPVDTRGEKKANLATVQKKEGERR